MTDPHYHSPLFRDFRSIESDDHLRIIHFFEEKENELGQLAFAEYYDLLQAYVDALFNLGEFRKHLLVVDHAIEQSFHHETSENTPPKLFERLLYQKAMAYFRTLQPVDAERILRELLRIDPWHRAAADLLHRSLWRQQVRIQQLARAGAISLFGLSALIILLEALLVRPFYHQYVQPVHWMRNIIFLLGIISLVTGMGYTWLKTRQETLTFVRSVQRAKQTAGR